MTYRYLILIPNEIPFLTNYFDKENNFFKGMSVYDLANKLYTYDGETWNKIEVDHL